jgi:HSP20 family protein
MYSLELRPTRKQSLWSHHNLLDREFDKFFDLFKTEADSYTPVCEVTDEEKQYSISLDIPGIPKEGVQLEVKDNHLFITGERKSTEKVTKDNLLKTERRYGKFTRVFSLPQHVNAEAIEARVADGVLDIIIPKEEKTQSRKITISDRPNDPKTIN